MKKRTADLTGAELDYAVALALGRNTRFMASGDAEIMLPQSEHRGVGDKWFTFLPSTDWSQGGPIIEREKIGLEQSGPDVYAYVQHLPLDGSRGPTPLIAAMRCFVIWKLGEEVDIP